MTLTALFTPPNLHQNANGFTLVELMVVIVILAVFAGMLTMSVSSGDVRKNMAYQEHLVDSMQYLRLLSQERMQPMGIRFDVDKTGKPTAKVMVLQHSYANQQDSIRPSHDDDARLKDARQKDARQKNAMELTGMSRTASVAQQDKLSTPTWQADASISLPEPPDGLIIDVQAEQDAQLSNPQNRPISSQINQKIRTELASSNSWLTSAQTPQIIWFGTGEGSPVIITMQYRDRPVGDAIQLLPNGEVVYGATP